MKNEKFLFLEGKDHFFSFLLVKIIFTVIVEKVFTTAGLLQFPYLLSFLIKKRIVIFQKKTN
jgi:hypothetical protein